MVKLRRKNFEPIVEVHFTNEMGHEQHSVMRESTAQYLQKKGLDLSIDKFRGPWDKFKEFKNDYKLANEHVMEMERKDWQAYTAKYGEATRELMRKKGMRY